MWTLIAMGEGKVLCSLVRVFEPHISCFSGCCLSGETGWSEGTPFHYRCKERLLEVILRESPGAHGDSEGFRILRLESQGKVESNLLNTNVLSQDQVKRLLLESPFHKLADARRS